MINALESYPEAEKMTSQAIQDISQALLLVPFIRQIVWDLNASSQAELLRELTRYIKLEKYLPGQILFKAGEKGDK